VTGSLSLFGHAALRDGAGDAELGTEKEFQPGVFVETVQDTFPETQQEVRRDEGVLVGVKLRVKV
jgi:hypothetical protein